MKLINRNCPLCNSISYEIYYDAVLPIEFEKIEYFFNPILQSKKIHFQIVVCSVCGMIYSNPIFPENDIIDLFTKVNFEDYMKEIDARKIVSNKILDRIANLANQKKEKQFFLDYGAGTGITVAAAKYRGYEAFGVELSASARQIANDYFHVNIMDSKTFDVCTEQFEIVTLIGVIAHLYDPNKIIKKIHSKMKPAGLLYIITPNMHCFLSKILKNKWRAVTLMVLNYFTAATLTSLLEKNNFHNIQIHKYGQSKFYSMNYLISQLPVNYKMKDKINSFLRLLHLDRIIVPVNFFEHLIISANK